MEYIKEIKDNSVEEWAVKFSKFKPIQLSEETAQVWIMCTMKEDQIESDPEVEKVLNTPNEIQSVIYIMQKEYSYTITKAAILALSYIVGSFGEIRMILSYLQYMLHEWKSNHINMEFLSVRVFPWGVPSREFMSKMWDAQKYEGYPDNMLNYSKAYNSIKLK